MGNENEMLPISHQGSGAQRTLLWAALKVLTNFEATKSDRPFLLLIDEPELCLHPNAIREARETLYGLAEEHDWQVMVTTHSPAFIDFSRPHTKIARVERRPDGSVAGTTVFRPDADAFDDDDKANFKLLNLCDPYVAEFFFGGPIILVEGDTEYSAFNLAIELTDQPLPRAHIVRARGKSTLASLAKILNQFGSSYAILHDSDRPKTKDGKSNPAWKINQNIKDAVDSAPNSNHVRLVASLTNFENAYLNCEARSDKPYNAVSRLMGDNALRDLILSLYASLIDYSHPLPVGAVEWTDLSELEKLTS